MADDQQAKDQGHRGGARASGAASGAARRRDPGPPGAQENLELEHEQAPYVGENPKVPAETQDSESNRIKDPADWVTGDEPMTGAQKSYLKTLSEQVHEPGAYDPALDKAEASGRIDDLKRKRDGGGD